MTEEILFFEYNNSKYVTTKEDYDGYYRISRDTWNDGCYFFHTIVKGNSLNESVENFIQREKNV